MTIRMQMDPKTVRYELSLRVDAELIVEFGDDNVPFIKTTFDHIREVIKQQANVMLDQGYDVLGSMPFTVYLDGIVDGREITETIVVEKI